MATISAGDEEIGDVIADAIEKVGKDGVVNVEEGQTFGMDLEFTEGMQFDKGYISPYMVTDQDRMEAVLEDPYILIANQKIGSVRDVLPVLEQVIQSGKPILIIAEDVEGESLATLVVEQAARHVHGRRRQGAGLRRPPQADARGHRHPDRRRGHHRGDGPQAREHADLAARPRPPRRRGEGQRRRSSTAPVTRTAIKGRINQIKAEVENTDSDFDREKLQERLAKLSGGVAVVKVGAATETEMKEKKHRVEDALQATRAALEEGIVPGGGVALLQAGDAHRSSTPTRTTSAPARRSSCARSRSRSARSRRTPASRARSSINDVRKAKKGYGLNAATGEIVDLVAAGVIDPAMVTRSALQNAASIAKNILTTEAIVAEIPDKDGGGGGGMPDMGGMGREIDFVDFLRQVQAAGRRTSRRLGELPASLRARLSPGPLSLLTDARGDGLRPARRRPPSS